MIEILSITPQIVAATAAGYGAGQYLEQRARNTIAAERSALTQSHEDVTAESLGKQGFLRRSVATLAIMGATTGFLAGHITSEGNEKGPSPTGIALDNSYAAGLNGGSERVIKIANQFAASDSLQSQAVVAQNGDYAPIKLGDLSNERPYGPSSIDVAATVSMNTTFGIGAGNQNEAAQVVVVTDGNPIGKVDTIISKAKGPVNIANVNNSQGEVVKDLKEIANRTDGEYWGPGTNPKDIVSDVENTASKRSTAPAEAPNDNSEWLLASLVLGAATLMRYRSRKDETAVSQ